MLVAIFSAFNAIGTTGLISSILSYLITPESAVGVGLELGAASEVAIVIVEV